MSQAESCAKAAALRRLGYTVHGDAARARSSPAPSRARRPTRCCSCGDVITAVDGRCDANRQRRWTTCWRPTTRARPSPSRCAGGHRAPKPVSVGLHRTEVNLGYAANGKGPYVYVDLGIVPEDQIDYTFPFPVEIDVTNIGGPSAGLAMTLGVIDALDGGRSPAGPVAATGTIDGQGNVGDVGRRHAKDGGRRERRGQHLPRAAPGVQGSHVQGPGRIQGLRGLHARPGPGRAGRHGGRCPQRRPEPASATPPG